MNTLDISVTHKFPDGEENLYTFAARRGSVVEVATEEGIGTDYVVYIYLLDALTMKEIAVLESVVIGKIVEVYSDDGTDFMTEYRNSMDCAEALIGKMKARGFINFDFWTNI